MNHGPAVELGVDHASSKKAKLGVLFFFIYFFFYAGFVLIGVVNYELLSEEFALGLSLALFYGVGLIVFAVLLGILYNFLCTRYEDDLNKEEAKP
jgi:uncharacterized membrane protein (DUF485 family)